MDVDVKTFTVDSGGRYDSKELQTNLTGSLEGLIADGNEILCVVPSQFEDLFSKTVVTEYVIHYYKV